MYVQHNYLFSKCTRVDFVTMIDISVDNIDWETRALHDTDVQENMRML